LHIYIYICIYINIYICICTYRHSYIYQAVAVIISDTGRDKDSGIDDDVSTVLIPFEAVLDKVLEGLLSFSVGILRAEAIATLEDCTIEDISIGLVLLSEFSEGSEVVSEGSTLEEVREGCIALVSVEGWIDVVGTSDSLNRGSNLTSLLLSIIAVTGVISGPVIVKVTGLLVMFTSFLTNCACIVSLTRWRRDFKSLVLAHSK
jgi:hypothetical protein